jgi:hypothetical protein
MKICLIPSNHGLGHINRTIILANYLSKFFEITILGNKKKIKKFKINKKIHLINFEINLKINEIKKTYNQNWWKKIQNYVVKEDYDLYISDNLPEIANFSENSIIISNFFWHELFKIKNQKFLLTKKIIYKKKIPIFRNYIYKRSKLYLPIGFFNLPKKNYSQRKFILLSFGTAKFDKKDIIKEINSINFPKNYKYFIDSDIYKKIKNKKNIFPAKYSQDMFKKIRFAIIKPGFGIVQDMLKFSVFILSITNNMNNEFKNNANRLQKYKLLKKQKSIKNCLKFINDKNFIKSYNMSNIKWNGEKTIYRFISKNF